MTDILNKWVEVAQSTSAVVLGVAWTNGLVADAPILGMIPDIVHTIGGWTVAVAGTIGIFQKFSKK